MLDKVCQCQSVWISVDLHAKLLIIGAVFAFEYFHFDRSCVRIAMEYIGALGAHVVKFCPQAEGAGKCAGRVVSNWSKLVLLLQNTFNARHKRNTEVQVIRTNTEHI